MFPSRCYRVLYSGKRKGQACGRPCFGDRCKIHAYIAEMHMCHHRLVRGLRKGQICSKRCKEGNYCSAHKNSILMS